MHEFRLKFVYILSMLPLLGLAPWSLALGFSAMMFDAPGSHQNPRNWFLFLSFITYPLWSIYGYTLTSKAKTLNNHKVAYIGLGLSYLAPGLFALSLASLNYFCDGKHAC